MTAPHTPGPWSVDDDWRGLYIGEAGKVLTLARITPGRSETETLANARLMAAGPKLLAAAQRALTVLEGIALIRHEQDALADLDAAIRQAKGENQ